MDIHEVLKEHDQIIIGNLSDVDESVLTETEKIINSKEFKKSWRREVRRRKNAQKLLVVKKWLTDNWIGLLTLIITTLTIFVSKP